MSGRFYTRFWVCERYLATLHEIPDRELRFALKLTLTLDWKMIDTNHSVKNGVCDASGCLLRFVTGEFLFCPRD